MATYITAVVDEAGKVAALGSVDDVIVVDPEEVAAPNTLSLIPPFSVVGDNLPHHLAHVLHHHLVCWNVLQRKEAPVVYGGLGKPQMLLASLGRREGEREGEREREREREREEREIGDYITWSGTFNWLYCCSSLDTSPDVNRDATRLWFSLLPRPLDLRG